MPSPKVSPSCSYPIPQAVFEQLASLFPGIERDPPLAVDVGVKRHSHVADSLRAQVRRQQNKLRRTIWADVLKAGLLPTQCGLIRGLGTCRDSMCGVWRCGMGTWSCQTRRAAAWMLSETTSSSMHRKSKLHHLMSFFQCFHLFDTRRAQGLLKSDATENSSSGGRPLCPGSRPHGRNPCAPLCQHPLP